MRVSIVTAGLALLSAASGASADDMVASGRVLFVSNCSVCHGSEGRGAAGAFPSLSGTLRRYFGSGAGRKYLSQLLLTGMAGKIVSGGSEYYGAMPAFPELKDEEIEAILAYLQRKLNDPNGTGTPIPASQIAAARLGAAEGPSTKTLREEAQ